MIADSTPGAAALPWYDFPTTRPALDAIWRDVSLSLRAQDFDVPRSLDRTTPFEELLCDPGLVLSQCCGLDLFRPAARNVVPFAAPVMPDLNAPPGNYYSYIVSLSPEVTAVTSVVINNRHSHSGHTAIRTWLSVNGYSDYTVTESGSHARSLEALRAGQADVAAIDALSWRHLHTDGLYAIANSDAAPAPPFIVGAESIVPEQNMLDALDAALRTHGAAVGIEGVVRVSRSSYRSLARAAADCGILDPTAC